MSQPVSGYSRRAIDGPLVLPMVGALAGLLTWLIAEPFAQTAELYGASVGVHHFTYGSLFGWVNTAVEGALLGGGLATFLSLQRTTVSRALLAGLLAALLGGFLVCATDNLLDIFYLKQFRGGADASLSLIEYPSYALLDSLALAISIAVCAQPTGARLLRALLAGTLGGIADLIIRMFLLPFVMVFVMIFSHRGAQGIWFPFNPSRLAEHVALGLILGIVLPLTDRFMTAGHLQLFVGHNEFRSFPLFKSATRIGSAEGCEVPLYGFAGVAPVHAMITHDGRQFVLYDGGAPGGTKLNGAPIAHAYLNPGDHISVGTAELVFGASGSRAPYMPPYPQPVPYAVQPHAPVWVPDPAPFAVQPVPVRRPRLVAASGDEVLLAEGISLVGREPGMPVCLSADGRVSRRHAELAVDSNGVIVRDLGSTNGTEVNGIRVVAQVTLREGDVVRFGSTSLTFRDS